MTAAATRTFPVARTYQTWLRDLTAVQPRRLWFSHLLVHRVEALVAVVHSCRLESFPLALLRRLFGASSGVADLALLDRLQFDRQLAAPLLHEFAAAGLVHADGDGWMLTGAGSQALQTGGYTRRAEERRVFTFVDMPGGKHQYLPLTQTAGTIADAGEAWRFPPTILRECLERPAEWKHRVGFPAEVEGVVVEPRDGWRQVILDRAEHAPLLFVETAGTDGASTLTGYLVRGDNWTLQREPPALMLGDGWQDVLPDLAEGLSPEAWREAWLAWCQSRQLPASEAAACQIEYGSCKVHVQAPKALVERLKATRNEVLRGETWLTLGTGRTCAAAVVEIRELE
jgi:hypothetical protein